jgi:hypothetical protein
MLDGDERGALRRPGLVGPRRLSQSDLSHTGYDLGALEVFIWVEIARGQSKPQPDQKQKEVGSPPHIIYLPAVAPAKRVRCRKSDASDMRGSKTRLSCWLPWEHHQVQQSGKKG